MTRGAMQAQYTYKPSALERQWVVGLMSRVRTLQANMQKPPTQPVIPGNPRLRLIAVAVRSIFY